MLPLANEAVAAAALSFLLLLLFLLMQQRPMQRPRIAKAATAGTATYK
jgi:hypothetical protein